MRELVDGGLARPLQQRGSLRVDVHVGEQDAARALEREVAEAFRAPPHARELSPKWLYDARGSELFDAITRLPEYYPTRREREILQTRAGDLARASGADTLIELGSGTSEKT
ncbi:MAG TPA: L-histidine N(alpha)-methyltransferase, partial [Aggregicoccus sp.]|nr:L-histidine N(alpha)-methyltransferase [Aggregicoccus sp.]